MAIWRVHNPIVAVVAGVLPASQRGYKEVYKVLLEHGASEKKMASPPNYFEGPPLAPRDIYQRMMAGETIAQSREPRRIDERRRRMDER